MEQCFALQDFARGLHTDLVREHEINRGRLDAKGALLKAKEEELDGKIHRHNERVEKLSEKKERFSKRIEQFNEGVAELNEKDGQSKKAVVELNEREERLKEWEEELKKREELVEWSFEQQEAVLVEANEKGVSLASAVIEQRILLQRVGSEDRDDSEDIDDGDEDAREGIS